MKELKIGLFGVNSVVLNGEANKRIFEDSKRFISELAKPHELVIFDEVFVDTVESQKNFSRILEKWDDTRFDLLIIQSVGFGFGAGPVDLALSQKDVPIVLWALPEPDLKVGKGLERNSWCSVNMHAFHLNKLGVKYDYIYGLPGKDIEPELKKIIKALEVIKKLRKSTVGVIGSRVPGYYDSNFDELSLRKALGIKFEFFDLAQIFALFEKISEKEIENTAEKIYPWKKIDIDQYIANSTKLYIAIKKIVDEYNLSAISVKCWPDLQDILNIVACSVISTLGDKLIPTSCEGDMLGAVSMLIMKYFNADVTSLVDIADFDFKNNTFLVFHCGACPTKMAANRNDIEYREQSIAGTHPGIAAEFPLHSGNCGILRLREDNEYRGKYKMLFIEGEGMEGSNIIRGNTLKIKPEVEIDKIIETVIKNGFEHHYAFGYNIQGDYLLKLCEYKNIDNFFL